MVYTKQVWEDAPSTATPLSAARLNYIEEGIEAIGGDWASYTPSITGGTVGNGTLTGSFVQIGKTVVFRAAFTLGSTSTITGNFSFSLPLTASSGNFVATATIEDTGTARYFGMCYTSGTTAVDVYALSTSGANATIAPFSDTSPFTWTTNDFVQVSGVFQVP